MRASARNALEIARFGRLAEEYSAPFDIVDQGPNHRLRRYAILHAASLEGVTKPPIPISIPIALLIPPLMVTADVYDIAPDVSAVSALGRLGVEPWVVDFGAPERVAGGMSRSLDDHVRAVVRCVARARELTGGRDVHICGYSQGGMFAYQAAAYLRGEGIRSIVTFGSPVDLHKNLPAVRSDLTGALVRSLLPITKAVLDRIEGLPSKVTSTAFKLVSTRKEVEQRIEFLRSLHDRERIAKREARRRFLGGAGFVAWPGPAFRAFVEDFVVHNRMLSGGFVIDGRTVSLADLSCPILAFIGATDEIARPPTIRAIEDAAPNADVRFHTVRAGHFGIVVGSRAMAMTWPTVATWIHEIERGKSAQEALPEPDDQEIQIDDDMEPGDLDVEIDLFVDILGRAAKDAWRKLGDTLASASDTADAVRWQEPRLRRLARIEPDTRISASHELARRARETPDATFFLWRGRAFSYADADARVNNVARGLHACGVRGGDRVGVLMGSRPSLLTAATALGRLGAVSVIAPPTRRHARADALRETFARLDVRRVIVDPERALLIDARALDLVPPEAQVLILGGGAHRPSETSRNVIDLEAIDPEGVPLPKHLALDCGRARDVANILLRPSSNEVDGLGLRAVSVTNHRWALSAIGAAAACAIKPGDTVFCAVPLHHPTGILVSTGSALAGGARLALAGNAERDAPATRAHGLEMDAKDADDDDEAPQDPLDPKELLVEIRRSGATVVFYAGEMLRPLLETSVSRSDRHLPVRIFAGSGMRPELAARLRERFNVDTMEFYAGTAHRAILADPAGDAPGSLGGVLPGSAPVVLVKVDLARKTRIVDAKGHLMLANDDEPALLAVRVSEDTEPVGDTRSIVRDAFGDGSTWLVTSDVARRDAAGKHWFIDRLSGFVATSDGPFSLARVEDAFYTLPEVRIAAAWEMGRGSGEIGAAFSSSTGLRSIGGEITTTRLTEALMTLPKHGRPTYVARVPEIPLTEGFRPIKKALPAAAAASNERWHLRDEQYEPA